MHRPSSFDRFSVVVLCATLVLGYEAHLYSALFPMLNLVAVFGFTVALCFQSRGVVFRPAVAPLVLFGIVTLYALAACFLRPGPTATGPLVKLVAQLAVFVVTLTVFSRELTEETVNTIQIISIVLALLDLPVIMFDSFLIWETEHSRAPSVLYDPNYAGVIFGFGLVATIVQARGSRKLRVLCTALLGTALFFTFSKGSIIALFVALLFWAAVRRPLVLGIVAAPAIYILVVTMSSLLDLVGRSIPLLRIEAGLNLRDVYWAEAYAGILARPFLGHEFADVLAITTSRGYEHSSIHNYYLESAFLNGIPYACGVLLLIVLSTWRSARRFQPIATLLVFLAVAANNVTFSIGGVGLLPFVFALLVAYPFQRDLRFRAEVRDSADSISLGEAQPNPSTL